MSLMQSDPQTENLLVDVIGTLIGLVVVGGVAWALLYIRGRATETYVTMIIVVLGCVAIAMLAPKILRAVRSR